MSKDIRTRKRGRSFSATPTDHDEEDRSDRVLSIPVTGLIAHALRQSRSGHLSPKHRQRLVARLRATSDPTALLVATHLTHIATPKARGNREREITHG